MSILCAACALNTHGRLPPQIPGSLGQTPTSHFRINVVVRWVLLQKGSFWKLHVVFGATYTVGAQMIEVAFVIAFELVCPLPVGAFASYSRFCLLFLAIFSYIQNGHVSMVTSHTFFRACLSRIKALHHVIQLYRI